MKKENEKNLREGEGEGEWGGGVVRRGRREGKVETGEERENET